MSTTTYFETRILRFAQHKHPVEAARGATHLPNEGAQGACMNSNAVGPRSSEGRQATMANKVHCRPLRGAQGCHPPESVAGTTPT